MYRDLDVDYVGAAYRMGTPLQYFQTIYAIDERYVNGNYVKSTGNAEIWSFIGTQIDQIQIPRYITEVSLTISLDEQETFQT